MKNYKVLLFVLCIMLIFVLAACASSTPVPTTAATTGGTSPTTAGATTGPTTALDGKTILESACQSCHGLAPVYNTQASADQWTRIVDNMVARGAVLTADERTVLIAYLAANFK